MIVRLLDLVEHDMRPHPNLTRDTRRRPSLTRLSIPRFLAPARENVPNFTFTLYICFFILFNVYILCDKNPLRR